MATGRSLFLLVLPGRKRLGQILVTPAGIASVHVEWLEDRLFCHAGSTGILSGLPRALARPQELFFRIDNSPFFRGRDREASRCAVIRFWNRAFRRRFRWLLPR